MLTCFPIILDVKPANSISAAFLTFQLNEESVSVLL
jgi:hypothetical protein